MEVQDQSQDRRQGREGHSGALRIIISHNPCGKDGGVGQGTLPITADGECSSGFQGSRVLI